MDTILATVLFLVALGGVVAALGMVAWPRRARESAGRTLREDVVTGVAVLRGWGEIRARRLEQMRPGARDRR